MLPSCFLWPSVTFVHLCSPLVGYVLQHIGTSTGGMKATRDARSAHTGHTEQMRTVFHLQTLPGAVLPIMGNTV